MYLIPVAEFHADLHSVNSRLIERRTRNGDVRYVIFIFRHGVFHRACEIAPVGHFDFFSVIGYRFCVDIDLIFSDPVKFSFEYRGVFIVLCDIG